MAKQPRILFGEFELPAGQRLPFPGGNQLKAAYDMEVERIWIAASSVAEEERLPVPMDEYLVINPQVKGWPLTIPYQPLPARLFNNAVMERVDAETQLGWGWTFRYPFRIGKDHGFTLQARNDIFPSLAIATDRLYFAAHCLGTRQVPLLTRLLGLGGDVARRAVAPTAIGAAIASNTNDGREPLDVKGIHFIRGTSYNPDAVPGSCIPYPRHFYVRVRPTGKDDWSEDLVPLAAYGLSRTSDPYWGGIWWEPYGNLVIPQGVALDCDCTNLDAQRDMLVQIAILGYYDVCGSNEAEGL